MKAICKGIAVVAFVFAIVSVVFYLYKTKCPHARRKEAEDEEEGRENLCCGKKKAAPHARGYFNLNRIREAEESVSE